MSFAQLAEHYEGMTWDYPVETSDEITKEESSKICKLGYYGKPIKPHHVAALESGQPYKPDAPYTVIYHGRDVMEFQTLEEAKAYIRPRMQRVYSDTEVGSDYASYILQGFTLKD